jgi:hypothetical protein
LGGLSGKPALQARIARALTLMVRFRPSANDLMAPTSGVKKYVASACGSSALALTVCLPRFACDF